jgi:ABC-2 type transport system permease protein
MLSGLPALVRAHWRILRREPGYWIVTLGLAVTIIVVYGSLLTNPGSPQLGAVLLDDSTLLADSLDAMSEINGIDLETGSLEDELAALEDGKRWGVLVVPKGTIAAAERGEPATARLLYNGSSPLEAAVGRGVLREFVADLNEVLGLTTELEPQEMTVDGSGGLDLLAILFPGLIGMSLMFGNSWAAATLVGWRQLGILKRIAASPVRPVTLEIAQFVAFVGLSALQVAILLALGQLLFDVNVSGSYLTLAIVAATGAVAFMAIWYALATLISSTAGFFATLNVAAFVMIFLGGSVVPTENVPDWIKPVTQALPLTHLNDALRDVINDAANLQDVADKLLILVAWAVVGIALSTRLFRWGHQ